LIALAYLSRAGVGRLRATVQGRIDMFKKLFAVVLVVVGLGILTGYDKRLEAVLTDQLPDAWLTLTSRF
jgi:hypothetical protein